MRFKAHRMKTLIPSWGIRFEWLTGRIYLGVHLGNIFRSWWIEWGSKGSSLKPSPLLQ